MEDVEVERQLDALEWGEIATGYRVPSDLCSLIPQFNSSSGQKPGQNQANVTDGFSAEKCKWKTARSLPTPPPPYDDGKASFHDGHHSLVGFVPFCPQLCLFAVTNASRYCW